MKISKTSNIWFDAYWYGSTWYLIQSISWWYSGKDNFISLTVESEDKTYDGPNVSIYFNFLCACFYIDFWWNLKERDWKQKNVIQ